MEWKRKLCIGLVVLGGGAVCSGSAWALSGDALRTQVNEQIKQLARQAGDERQQLSSENMDALSRIIAANPNVESSDVLDADLMRSAISGAFVKPRLDVETMRSLVVDALRSSDPVSNDLSSLGVLLIPYMQDAGLCEGDPWSEAGASCGFLQPIEGASAAMTVTDNVHGTEREFPSIPENSDLYQIVNVGHQTCSTALAANQNRNSSGIEDDVLSEMDWDGCYRLGYGWGYYLRYRFGFFSGIELWGEVYGLANFQLAASSSDTAFGVAPVGMSCNWSCMWRLIGCAIRGDDLLACALSSVRREYYFMRPSSEIHHAIRGTCGATPADYQSRPTWLALQRGYLKMPQGLGFGTSFQYGNTGTTAHRGTHLYPASSYADLTNPDWLRWTHSMSQVRAWHNNVVFAGIESVDSPTLQTARGTCRGVASDGGESKSGDVFWYWHGRQYNSSIFKHTLPEIRLWATVNAGHDPIICDPQAVTGNP